MAFRQYIPPETTHYTPPTPPQTPPKARKDHVACTPSKRRVIVYMRDEGDKPFTEIGRYLNIDPGTARQCYEKMKETGSPYYRRAAGKKTGKERKIQQEKLDEMIRAIERGEVREGEHARLLYCPDVSSRAVRRTLTAAGLFGRKRVKKPKLTQKQKERRLGWAHDMDDMSADDWKDIIFSDESKYNIFGSDGVQYCRRRVGEALEERNLRLTVPHGGGSIMVWGCITRYGTGRLVRIEGKVNGQKYVEILKEGLFGTLEDHNMSPDNGDVVFQQDNDPKHTSCIAADFLDKHHIPCLPWPAQSPDINIIENLWAHLECRVRKRVPLPSNKEQLWTALQEEWENLDLQYIHNLYDSLPNRINLIKHANGGPTRY